MKRNNKSLPKGVTKQPSIGFVNLSTYTSPEVKEVKNKDWVEYGADNNYFQFLIDRYNGSATNNAAINGISQAIYGKGLNATDANKKPDQYAQMISMFGKDCVRKLSYDLKLMGQCAAQIIYSKDRKKIVKVEHFPIETLRAEKANEEGDVPAYYYFKDWTNIKPSDTPLRIPAFGMSKEDIEILYIKPYKAGFYYYSPVDYQGGLQYCELEEEISNYHINNVMHGLAPSMLINFNNGTPNQEERELLESKIAGKFSGTSNAGKFILAFNDNAESKADITPVQLSDAHNQYQFLSTEATQKIMVAHRVVSPMLLGIKDNSGLGNNAEEIKTASLLMDNTVIRPFQELLIDSFDQILAYNDICVPIKASEEIPELTDEMGNEILAELEGEVITDEWELVDEREYEGENLEEWATQLIQPSKSKLQKFADQITGKPKVFSVLDKNLYKIRYKYFKKSKKAMKSGNESRLFCSNMMKLAGQGIIYRIEDIDKASDKGINKRLGHKGKPYNLFKFKGGIYCRHAWKEQLYRLKKNTEKTDDFDKYKRARTIPKSYKPSPRGWKEAQIAPVNMPNQGAYPTKKK